MKLDVGAFLADELSLGPITRHEVVGLSGIFPRQLERANTIGFPLGGLISHNFLRHYRWAIDFASMRMQLTADDHRHVPR